MNHVETFARRNVSRVGLSASLGLVLCLGCSSSDTGTGSSTTSAHASTVGSTSNSSSGSGGSGGGGGQSYEDLVNQASWVELANGPKVSGGAKQDDIYFTNAMHGFAVSGPASTIYQTVDGGANWTTSFTHSGTYFRSVLMLDDDHLFASNLGPIPNSGITDPVLMYESKDTGATWNPVTNITGPMPTGICNQTKVDAQHLISVGRVQGPSFMMQSADSGATWTSTDLNTKFAMLIDARFTSPTDGILVGGSADATMKCTIAHTTDGGATFQTVFTSATANSLCWKISFPSDQVGYVSVQDAAGGKGTFAKTTDGGATWTEMPLYTKAYPAIGIGFITENIGWVGADSTTLPVLKTTDGGMTWNPDPVLKSPVNRFRFVDKQTAYAIGASVYKLTIGE